MSHDHEGRRGETSEAPAAGATGVGKRTLVASRYPALGKVMRDGGDAGGPTIHDAATAAVEHKDGGAPVDSAVAERVGAHLGADFSGVRVHGDPLAREASAAMGARAFAHGSDVFLGPGESGGDLGLMAHELTHVVQQGAAGQRAPQRAAITVGESDSPAERQADQVATEVTSGATRPGPLLVDDGPVGPGQMLKSQFIDALRPQVTAAADQELGPIYSAIGCPYIDRYFGRYANEPASAGLAMLNRFAPATRGVRTAAEMIPIVVARVRDGVRTWRETGQAPPEIAAVEPAAASAGGPAAAPAQALRAPDGRETLASLEAELGPGQPLDGATAARMSGALGADLSAVRLHTGATAARKASDAGALAFAVGEHVVMGAGAPAAGTLEGDALLAHELAHTAQQAGAASDPMARMMPIGDGSSTAEADADRAAAGALVALHGDVSARASMSDRVGAAFRSGLQLQRCDPPSGGGGGTVSQQDRDAIAHNNGLGYDAASIRSIQTLVGATTSGAFDAQTVQRIATWQGSHSLTANGKIEAATLEAIVNAMVAANIQDAAIHLIVDAYNLPTTNLARIYWDASFSRADAETSGTIATGSPQTVVVGPSTFAGSYAHAVKIIGHELQHVQQRSGATPITNQNVREFLAYAWEALDTTTPALTAGERVNHANIALRYWGRIPPAEQTPWASTHTRLQTLITNGGVGNP